MKSRQGTQEYADQGWRVTECALGRASGFSSPKNRSGASASAARSNSSRSGPVTPLSAALRPGPRKAGWEKPERLKFRRQFEVTALPTILELFIDVGVARLVKFIFRSGEIARGAAEDFFVVAGARFLPAQKLRIVGKLDRHVRCPFFKIKVAYSAASWMRA